MHVSVEVERSAFRGRCRRRLSLLIDIEECVERVARPPRRQDARKLGVAALPARKAAAFDSAFDDAVTELVRAGFGRDRARHIVAIRMDLPEEQIARLREAAQ